MKAVYNNPLYKEYIDKEFEPTADKILSDCYADCSYKKNEFFKNNPKAFKLLFYKDSFEIVNALGSAKKI